MAQAGKGKGREREREIGRRKLIFIELYYVRQISLVVICPNYLRQMNLSPDEAGVGQREEQGERD